MDKMFWMHILVALLNSMYVSNGRCIMMRRAVRLLKRR
nr:MAG TPA: hypothetical protein [Caudoviricetes sp.]